MASGIMASTEFVRERDEARRAATRHCLESELENNPDNVNALTALATILTINYLNDAPGSLEGANLQRAIELAHRAYDVAPQRAESQTAVFFTQFYDQRFDDAFRIAQEAERTNPNSTLLMARVARAYISRERYDEGLALMEPFEAANSAPPASMLAPLAIAALMRGDHEKALQYAQRTTAALSPLGLVARIVACHETGDGGCVVAAISQLRTEYPRFAKDVPGALQRHCYTESIRARLLNGLKEAGWTANGAATEAQHDVQQKP